MSISELRGVLEAAREAAENTTDLGNRFERLCVSALMSHAGSQGIGRFEHVWLWSEWPSCDGPDTGIDLVAKQTDAFGGGLCAVQCKFYKGQISTGDVDSFLAASSRVEFSHRVLMHTGPSIQHHGAVKLRKAHPPCEVFCTDEMGRWKIDWWDVAERSHAVAPGTPRSKVHESAVGGFFHRLTRTWRLWRASWRRRWGQQGRWLQAWLIAESLLVTAGAAAVIVVVVLGLILAALATVLTMFSSAPKKRRRRRRR